MARWQKQARWVLALVAIGVISSVAYTMRPRQVAAPPAQTEALPPGIATKTEGGEAIRYKAGDRDIAVAFKSQTTSTEGETKLHDVQITVEKREGRSFVVTGNEAFLGKDNSSFDVRGDVKLETSDGLTATGQQATYAEAEKIVRVPGPVKFTRERMSGSGVGFTYDEQRDTMWILDQADVKFAADKTAGPMAFTAG
ncbi:MAG: LPS export ABC transporter periplasmic protein LptC, partial [Vicinamibacterales bacterium]